MTAGEMATRLRHMAMVGAERIKGVADDESRAAVARIQAHFVPYGGGGRSPDVLQQRSGRFRFGWRSLVTQLQEGETRAQIFLDQSDPRLPQYASAQIFGATIVPRLGKALAIPLAAQRDSRGVQRFAGPRSARTAFDLWRPKGSGTLFGKRRGTQGPGAPQFLLRRSVRLTPHPFPFLEAAEAAARIAHRLGTVLVEVA